MYYNPGPAKTFFSVARRSPASPNDTAIPPESEVTTHDGGLKFPSKWGRESTSVMAAGRGSARRGHGAWSLRREIAGAAEEDADLARLEGAAGGGRRVRPPRARGRSTNTEAKGPSRLAVQDGGRLRPIGLRNLGFSQFAAAWIKCLMVCLEQLKFS